MNGLIQSTATVRQRRQLTIPDRVWGLIPWLRVNTVVSVIATPSEEIVIKPYQADQNRQIDWKRIWERIEIADSFWGRRGNLSQFIIEDRDKRR